MRVIVSNPLTQNNLIPVRSITARTASLTRTGVSFALSGHDAFSATRNPVTLRSAPHMPTTTYALEPDIDVATASAHSHDSNPCACGLVLDGSSCAAYNEEAFRYFLDLE